MSLVRENLMTQPGYTPYCGDEKCVTMTRTAWDGEQFKCKVCGWKSQFSLDFITEYKLKWSVDAKTDKK